MDVYDSLGANCENMTLQFLVVPSKISAGSNFFFSSPGEPGSGFVYPCVCVSQKFCIQLALPIYPEIMDGF